MQDKSVRDMRGETTEGKNESITFRIDKKVLDKLRSYAKNQKTTLNSTVNQSLEHSVDWDILAAATGWIPMPKNVLISILNKLDEKTIAELATKMGKSVPRDILFGMKGKSSVREWISILKSRARAAGFHYNEIEENESIKFITQHDMGIKWSIYFKTYYESAFMELGCNAEFDLTNNTLVYTVDKKYIT